MKFPSPHGDKFQLNLGFLLWLIAERFRPLTGINFNVSGDALLVKDVVSVPSRG